MDFKTYMGKVEEQLKRMTAKQKTEWIYEQARIVSEESRQDFLDCLSGKKKEITGLSAEDIFHWCEQVEQEELYFEARYGYEDAGWYSDEVIEYQDTLHIIPYLQKAIQVCEQLVAAKEYASAYRLLDRMYGLEFAVRLEEDEDYEEEPIDLRTLKENGLLSMDLKEFMLNLLYACYQETTGLDRLEELYDYLTCGFDSNIRITDLFAFGPEEMKEKEAFMQEWRAFLLPIFNDRAIELLVDACVFIGGKEELLKTAREQIERHPALYLSYCKITYQEADYPSCVKIAKEAINRIEENKVIRGDIADIGAKAAETAGLEAELPEFYYAAFHSDPKVFYLLRFYKQNDAEIFKRALNRVEDLKQTISNKIGMTEYRNCREQEKTAISNQRYIMIFQFLLGDYKRVLKQCRQDKAALGWSGSEKGTIIPLLLLYLKKDESVKTMAEYKLIEDLKDKMGLYRLDLEEYGKYMALWRATYGIAEEDKPSYIEWLLEEIDGRTTELVGGGRRNSYHKAAELIVVMGAVQEERGEINGMRKLIDHYKMLNNRKTAFKSEIEALAKKR